MDLSLLWTIGIIHLVALVSPGPDFAIVVKLASQQSRSAALACAAGISAAILAHTILSLTGVSLLIQSSNYAYVLMQLVGASYLGWMGIGALTSALKSLKNKPNSLTTPISDVTQASGMVQESNEAVFDKLSQGAMPSRPVPQVMSNHQGFLKGLYTNLLNPKALVFFMTLFSALITPDVNQGTKAAAALLLFSLSFIWFGFLAIMLTKERVKQHLIRLTPAIDAVVGLLFTSVALAIIYQLLSTQLFV